MQTFWSQHLAHMQTFRWGTLVHSCTCRYSNQGISLHCPLKKFTEDSEFSISSNTETYFTAMAEIFLNQRPKWTRNCSPGLGWSYVTLCYDGHLGYQIRLLLAIQNPMLFEEFKIATTAAILDTGTERFSNSEFPCHPDASHQVSAQSDFGGDVVWRISIWRPSWILEQNDFSNSEFPKHPNPSHQVKAQSDLPFRSWSDLKIFKMDAMVTILDIRTELF